MRVLVIEDDEELAETVAAGLRNARMAVDVALDGTAGLARARVNEYDVILIDRDLPGLHGDRVCAELVGSGCRSRVLMLTAAASTADLIEGLGLGADDYLGKLLASDAMGSETRSSATPSSATSSMASRRIHGSTRPSPVRSKLTNRRLSAALSPPEPRTGLTVGGQELVGVVDVHAPEPPLGKRRVRPCTFVTCIEFGELGGRALHERRARCIHVQGCGHEVVEHGAVYGFALDRLLGAGG
jgi:CheY-like chemotaxis protein